MRPPSPVPRVRDYFRILARYWIVILCTTALSMVAGWVALMTTDPEYRATSVVLVEVPGSAEVYDAFNGSLAATGRALTIMELARNPQVAKRTIDQLGLHQTPAELVKRITPVVHDAVVEISCTGDSPDLARDTANSVTFNLIALAGEMSSLDKSGSDVVVVNYATSGSDSRPSLKVYLELGAVLGLAMSALLVIALGRWRDSVLTEEQIARIVDEAPAERNG